MMKKKRLTQQQEFEIMKLVLDKFLWIGFAVMAYGVWQLLDKGWVALQDAATWFIVGVVVLIVFMWVIVKEYEFIK